MGRCRAGQGGTLTATASDTPWAQGRFDQRTGPRRVLFGQMYEDPEVELRVFPDGAPVFCIASFMRPIAGLTKFSTDSRPNPQSLIG